MSPLLPLILFVAIGVIAGARRLGATEPVRRAFAKFDRIRATLIPAGPKGPAVLQRRALAAGFDTALPSVDGTTWLPDRWQIEVHPEDREVIAEVEEWFRSGLSSAAATVADERGWRLDHPVVVTLAASDIGTLRGWPNVRGHHSGPHEHLNRIASVSRPGASVATERFPASGEPTVTQDKRTVFDVDLTEDSTAMTLVSENGTWSVGTSCTIGRDDAADIVFNDRRVSRRHLEIRRSEAGYTARDLGSSNGTRVNGERVDAHPVPLADGAVITLATGLELTCSIRRHGGTPGASR